MAHIYPTNPTYDFLHRITSKSILRVLPVRIHSLNRQVGYRWGTTPPTHVNPLILCCNCR